MAVRMITDRGATAWSVPTSIGDAGTGASAAARGAILVVLRLDGLLGLAPVVVAPIAQLIEVAAHRQRLRAVHRDGLAVDPVATAGDQEYGEVLQLFHAAGPTHRVHRPGSRAGFVTGLDALAHALGRDLARRDGVEADAIAAPFGGKGHRHGVDRRLAHGRWHHIGRAVAHPGDGDRHDVAGLLGGDPAPSDGVGDIEGAVHDDVGDGIEAART